MDFFQKHAFVLGIFIYIIIFIAFFPKIYSSIDEHTILKNAILIKSGKIAEPTPELACRSSLLSDKGYLGAQFIGRSIAILPFSYFDLNAVMLSGLLIHLINAFIIYFILRKLSINPNFALLYLFFPVMLWESRTLYSEIFVLTFFLAGFYFYINNEKFSKNSTKFENNETFAKNLLKKINKLSDFIAGAFFGLAIFVRYDALIGIIAFSIPLLIYEKQRFIKIFSGFIPIFSIFLLFNYFVYGNILGTGYGSGIAIATSIIQKFSINWLINFFIYSAILLIIFPGMLLSPYFMKDKKFLLQFILLSLGYLAMNSRFTDFLSFDFSIQTLFTGRLRYLVPLIGMLLIPYSGMIDALINKFKINKNNAIGVAILLMSAGAIFASAQHNNFIDSRYFIYEQINSLIPSDSLIVGSSDDCIYSISKNLERRKYLNVIPKLDLGFNSPVSLDSYINSSTYFLDINYNNLKFKTGLRQRVIVAERKAMSDFINSNKEKLELVFETSQPNDFKIYKWKGD